MKTNNETLSQVMNRLNEKGFKEQFKIVGNEVLAITQKKKFNPKDLHIVDKYRFDGMTNPSDESTLYAVSSNDGLKGTLVVTGRASTEQTLIKEIPTK